MKDLATDYCRGGVSVCYQQMDGLEHIAGLVLFIPNVLSWISGQFSGDGTRSTCAKLLK